MIFDTQFRIIHFYLVDASTDTEKKVQLQRPVANFAPSPRVVYNASIKIFYKSLASNVQLLKDKMHFI
jgi:hypothetical protein